MARWWSWIAWRPVGAAALATAAVGAVLLTQPASLPTPGVDATASGVVRYLDTGGRSVLISEREDVTIIWVMGSWSDDV